MPEPALISVIGEGKYYLSVCAVPWAGVSHAGKTRMLENGQGEQLPWLCYKIIIIIKKPITGFWIDVALPIINAKYPGEGSGAAQSLKWHQAAPHNVFCKSPRQV